MKVFIADDSEIVRKRLRELIDEIEHVELIGEASNVTEALDLLKKLEPDIVVLDIRMPGGNGMAVLEELQKRDVLPITIVYTSFAYAQYREAYMRAGANYFLDKAQETDVLLDVLFKLSESKGDRT